MSSNVSDIRGADFDRLVTLESNEAILSAVVESLASTGLQATEFARAREIVAAALYRKQNGDRVFVSYTSNLISCGLRECFAFLAKHKLVDGFVSTAGGVEEDAVKCMGKTLLGSYHLDGKELRAKGLNRIGNLIVPNDNYCAFEDFFTPVLKSMHAKQRENRWTALTAPSDFIYAMGEALDGQERCETSVAYWCYKHKIPFFSPAYTDGSMGDMVYFYNFSKKGLVVDPMPDVARLRGLGRSCSGTRTCIVLGGGLPKHYLLSNVEADRIVMVTTGVESDGGPSSCSIEDDRVCGLIRPTCKTVVRVHADATLVFPLMVQRTP